MILTLPWFPPAPAAGPLSILDLPPDEWALEPKIDGIRVIWLEGRVYTRHGMLLSLSKGADKLVGLLKGIDVTLDGEWVPFQDTFVAFDLPDCPLNYDRRREELVRILDSTSEIGTCLNSSSLSAVSLATCNANVRLVADFTIGNFPQIYASLKGYGAEGVVLKRRRSLYVRQTRPGMENRDWIKRRFRWD